MYSGVNDSMQDLHAPVVNVDSAPSVDNLSNGRFFMYECHLNTFLVLYLPLRSSERIGFRVEFCHKAVSLFLVSFAPLTAICLHSNGSGQLKRYRLHHRTTSCENTYPRKNSTPIIA